MVEAKPERDGKDFIKTQNIKRVEEGVSLQFKATKISAMKPYSIETEVITY